MLHSVGQFLCSSLSKSRANLENLGYSIGWQKSRDGGSGISTTLALVSWEFAPHAASAMLQRST
jgi:hypothetical protein